MVRPHPTPPNDGLDNRHPHSAIIAYMNSLRPTSSSPGSRSIDTKVDAAAAGSVGIPKTTLQAPDAPRQGGLPDLPGRSATSLFRGAVLTAATAIMLAVSMPVQNGAALADPIPMTQPAEVAAEAQPVRGQITTGPDASGVQGYWMVPLRGQQTLEVEGEPVNRIWLGAVGSPETAGLQASLLGDVDLAQAESIKIVATEAGAEAYAVFPAAATVLDAATIGLPRDVSGTVRRGAAPDAPGGAEADHLYLQLEQDAVVYLNGQAFTDVVHLGPEGDVAFAGLQVGAHADLGARLHAVDTEQGPMAQAASVLSLSTQGLEGAPVTPPFLKEGTFYSAQNETLPVITLSNDGWQSDIVVIDAESARAHRGGLTEGGATFKGFIEDFALTQHLSGGPQFELKEGTPMHEGRALQRMTPAASDAPVGEQSGWYRDAESGAMFHLTFGANAAQAQATMSFNAP